MDGSSLSADAGEGITSSEPNGKPSVSVGKNMPKDLEHQENVEEKKYLNAWRAAVDVRMIDGEDKKYIYSLARVHYI